MLFSLPSQRTSARTLSQIAQRNILRRHRQCNIRHETTNAKSTHSARNASTVAGNPSGSARTFWSWAEPLKRPIQGYVNMQQRSPLMTQVSTTSVIYFVGDLSAQAVATDAFKEGRYEPIRGLRAMIIGAVWAIPSYKFFMWLGHHFNYSSHWKGLVVKILFAQTFFTPCINTYFFGMQSLLSGSSLSEAYHRIVATVPVSWLNSWKLWPAVTAINFTYVQPQHRNVFAGFIAIFWQTYLTWLNRQAELAELQKQQSLPQPALILSA